jgi:hypothetical protein
VYLEAFVPRALRLTDQPSLGALVQTVMSSSMRDKQAKVDVEAYDEDVFTFASNSITVSTASASAAALFAVTVVGRPAPGTLATIDLALSVDEKVLDRMRMSLAVDLHARPILIGTSRAVAAADAGARWEEVLELPERIASESEVTLAAAVSQYDRIRHHCRHSAFDPVIALISSDQPTTPSASDVIAAAYCLHVLRSEDRPSCAAGSECALHNKYLGSTAQNAALLKSEYTDGAGRLQWTSDRSAWSYSQWVDVSLPSRPRAVVSLVGCA